MTPELKLRGFSLALNTHRMNIICRTLFDCTCTGVTGHFRSSQVPYSDRAGQLIHTVADWNRSRNQHRNWETIMQMISLRAQPTVITEPTCTDRVWSFEFSVETPGVYSTNNDVDNLDGLLNECDGIPMIVGLDEADSIEPSLTTSGTKQNLWFETINK